MLFGPWWLRMAQALTAERTARIRAQERAEVAAHLHDSVLQTLALIQRRADDPAEVAQLARRQERELRAWLNADDDRRGRHAARRAGARGGRGRGATTAWRSRSSASATGRSTTTRAALAAAAREAILNAAKFAGAGRIDVFAEASGERAEVFVRDRGAGLRPRRGARPTAAACASRSSGGWSATAAAPRSAAQPGGGTEVELVLERL